MPLGIAAHSLVVADIGLLEIVAAPDQQQLESILVAGPPVQLPHRAGALAEIVELLRLRRIQKPSRGEAIHEKVIAQLSSRPAVVGVQVEIVQGSAEEIQVAVPTQIRA